MDRLLSLSLLRVILAACLVMGCVVMGCSSFPEHGVIRSSLSDAPPAPTDIDSASGGSGQIVVTWSAVSGAAYYNIYRGIGGPGTSGTATIDVAPVDRMPIASTTDISYTDTSVTDSVGVASSDFNPSPTYYYAITAVDSSGNESPQSDETACATPLPSSPGDGQVPGVSVGDSSVYYCKDALLTGFDFFQPYQQWFPQILNTVRVDGLSRADTPGGFVVDMAYADNGTLQFNNVTVPETGVYALDFRYAFDFGFFPDVTNRAMGLQVNGTVVDGSMPFIVTHDFENYNHSFATVSLNAGQNSIVLFAISHSGVPRLDTLTVTRAGP